jgi:hypothetical protein
MKPGINWGSFEVASIRVSTIVRGDLDQTGGRGEGEMGRRKRGLFAIPRNNNLYKADR